jgi:uncharacterized membrane protein YbhN (UPF0104 family)
MIIDLKKTILRKQLANFFVLIILALVMCLLLFIPFKNDLIHGLSNNLLAVFFAIAYVIKAVYESFRNYNYIYVNDESDKIVFRYFSANIFATKKNSIEIPKKDFAGYSLHSFFMRYRETITLFRHSGKGQSIRRFRSQH